MKLLTAIQARTGSTRLPGKVLLPVGGAPMLIRQIERIRRSRLAGEPVVLTTWLPEDDVLYELCRRHDIRCFRGHPTDLLDRHYQAAQALNADAVAKIPSDCPLIDPAVIDRVLAEFLYRPGRWDYVGNAYPATYPDGNDVEVFTAEALETAWREAIEGKEREHTTPYFWTHPSQFRIGHVAWERGDDGARTYRLSVDYEEDYQLVCAVYDALAPKDPAFGLDAIVAFLDQQPEVQGLNASRRGQLWYLRPPFSQGVRHEL